MKGKITDTWTFKLNTVFQIGFSSLVEEIFSSVGRNIPHPTGSALCVTLITNGIKLKRPWMVCNPQILKHNQQIFSSVKWDTRIIKLTKRNDYVPV